MVSISSLIPKATQLQNRIHKNYAQTKGPSSEAIINFRNVLDSYGYKPQFTPVLYDAILDYGANELENSNTKGLFLKGNVGTGKSFGVEIFATQFKWPILLPSHLVSLYKKHNGDLHYIERDINYDFFEKPQNIVIDELRNNNSVRNFGETANIISEVLDMRYRAFVKYGARTIVTSNLTDKDIVEQYGLDIDDRLNEMFCFKNITGKSLRK